jgi:hypothetical protein
VVIAPFRPLPPPLRLTVLALVLLGVLVKPIYSTWCETHQLGHTVAALGHEKFRPDSAVERQLDAEHARGAHGLLHASDDGGAYVGIAAIDPVPAVIFDSVLNPPSIALPVPVQRIARPFRPPIA